MAQLPEPFIRQVAQATDIVELVGRYVALNRRGKEFVGLCPFHDDRNPSLRVSPAKQLFKCFACGAGGGVFQFLMLYDKLAFPEAVRLLAERAGIALPQAQRSRTESQAASRADLLNANAFAEKFFRSQLHSPAGRAALDYARSRSLTDESIDRFAVGYAPGGWDALARAARKQGLSEAALVSAGLAVRRREGAGVYDRFRNRLMLPIYDVMGRAIAFGGRAMDPEDNAKYLNSAESPLFEKSSHLYALNWARDGIVSQGQALVAEGYFDALMPLQAGIPNVVATLGTALTDRHVRLLARYAREVVLLFDADAAGAAAAERALEIFLAQQVHLRVATVPEGKDPCDYVLAEGPDALRALAERAPDALEYAWSRRRDALEAAAATPADRRREVERFLRLIATSEAYGAIDEIRRGQLAQHIGHLLNIPIAELQGTMRRLSRRARSPAGGHAAPDEGSAAGPLAERQVLEVLINRPQLFDHAADRIGPGDFHDPGFRRIAESLWEAADAGRLCLDGLLSTESLADVGGVLADLAESGEKRGNYEATLCGAVEGLLYRRNKREIQELKTSISDDESLRALHRRLRSPDARRHPGIR